MQLMNIHKVYFFFQKQFRPKRMKLFIHLFEVDSSTKVLDVGGTLLNWSFVKVQPRLTILNIHPSGGQYRHMWSGLWGMHALCRLKTDLLMLCFRILLLSTWATGKIKKLLPKKFDESGNAILSKRQTITSQWSHTL